MIDFAVPPSALANRQLRTFLAELTRGEPVAIGDTTHPPWFEPGIIYEISIDTYLGNLGQIRPAWQFGRVFVSYETRRLVLWREGNVFYGRKLTVEQSSTFDELVGRLGACRADPGADHCSGDHRSCRNRLHLRPT